MQNLCPTCGAETFPGARFCRRCGAVLHAPAGDGREVSPQAATVPLKEETRTTDGLAPDEEATRPSADTSRVSRAELERLLREYDPDRPANPGAAGDALRTRPGRAYETAQDSASAYDPEATLPSQSDDLGEVTVTVPRRPGPFDTHGDTGGFAEEADETLVHAPRPTRDTGAFADEGADDFEETRPAGTARAADDAGTNYEASPAGATPTGQTARGRRRWPSVVALCGSVLVVVVVAGWLASRFWGGSSPTDAASQAPVAPPAPDARQQFEQKLAEAESLLAQGNMADALARLREANGLDPSNTRARRRLAELLLASGSRREAIEELKAVARLAPEDFTAWRQLAAAQYAEGLHRDAAESYQRLVRLVGDAAADPNDLLSYADSLRLSGRAEEARAVYGRLTGIVSADVATIARQRLAELSQPTPTPSDAARPEEATAGQQPRHEETAAAPQPQPPSQPAPQTGPTPQQQSPQAPPPQAPSDAPPADRFRRGVELWATNRPAALSEFRAAARGGNPDAHYYIGLSYVEGKNINSLNRAEVVAALEQFQLAQRGGRFNEQSRRYAEQLGKALDRMRRQ